MADAIEPIDERMAARDALLSSARNVNQALPTFSTWLMTGFGAAFVLILANIDKVSIFIDIRNIRFAVLVYLLGVVIAIIANYLSVIVKSSIAASADGDLLAKRLKANQEPFKLDIFMTEFERGIFPHNLWVVRRSFEKAKKGDIVAPARLIAKISQVQALLVVAQGLLAVLAASAIACGMKL